jgi:hypothetical protein
LNKTLLSTLVLLANATWAETGKTPDPLFQNDETLQVTITAPLTTLVKERPKEDYLPGVFQFTEADGSVVNLDLEIRTRGHFRHKTCKFPPIRLNFKKSQTKGTLFDKQDKMKLVVHCGKSDRYEQNVLREYLIYRILNVVTDFSFRVRLLRVTYVDSEQERDEQIRYAYLIEHKNRLAKRLDRKEVEIERAMLSSLQHGQLNLTSIFEFLIGNTDFSPLQGAPGDLCCHNYVLFGNGDEPIMSVPYDFDQSGFVDAPYASPSSNFQIRNVRQRLYRGRCINNGHVQASLQKFRDSQDAIRLLVDEQEGLKSGTRKNVVRYIDKFYKLIDEPRDVQRQIIENCI